MELLGIFEAKLWLITFYLSICPNKERAKGSFGKSFMLSLLMLNIKQENRKYQFS